ncbi:hypothetical protein F2Q70_00001430 [Brassica cretica]|uniref:Uncharacterized protein n=1 Tax=Brassica cretica TaxID=69181 RepID=A0A8S9IU28_BRACR|nr:hypothetical protein F2Q70_00001430 [Brassica cretica]
METSKETTDGNENYDIVKLHYGKEEIVGRGEEERGGEDVVAGRRGGREEAMVGRGNVVVPARGGEKKQGFSASKSSIRIEKSNTDDIDEINSNALKNSNDEINSNIDDKSFVYRRVNHGDGSFIFRNHGNA